MIRVAIRCSPAIADRVLAELLELAPGGVEEEELYGTVEYAIYGPPGELPALPDLEAIAGEGLVEISSTEIPDDWADSWRDFHQPVWIADRVCVRPSWEVGSSSRAVVEVVIDPGQAFGTGAHPTTRMCLELLLELVDGGAAQGPLADLGTGSGVLAIAAAKLGWDPVVAVDHEQAALEAAGANASANGVEVELRRLNLRREPPPAAETVTANLTAPLLRDVASRLDGQPPSEMVCSGLLSSEAKGVAEAFSQVGLSERNRLSSGDWAALRFTAT